jgi:hypothetical protein
METPKKEKRGKRRETKQGKEEGRSMRPLQQDPRPTPVSDATVSGAYPPRARNIPNTTNTEQPLTRVCQWQRKVRVGRGCQAEGSFVFF